MIKAKFSNIFFVFITLVMSASCVPKASEKKAVCGTNQAFESVSRSCYSIAEIRYKPLATKSSETFVQETSEVLTLSYSDKNSDQAVSCEISSVSSNLEVMSPLIVNGGLFTQALEVYDSADDLNSAIQGVAVVTAAINAKNAMLAALTKAQTTYTYATIIAQMGVFQTEANTLLSIAANYPTNGSVQFFVRLTQDRLTALLPLMTFVENRCVCNGGVCTTTVIPKINQTGTGGFTYTVTDVDGESDPKAVTTSITAMAATTGHLKPVAESSYKIFTESTTSTSPNYLFQLPGGADLFGTTSFTYTFSGTKISNQGITAFGKVWGCMDLAGSDGPADKDCLYATNTGDLSDNLAVDYATAIGDLTFDALTPGTFGNSITVQYFNIQNNLSSVDPYLTKTQLFGMISPVYNESFVRVVGNAIKVFINPGLTTSADIRDMLSSHPQAMKLVTVTGGSAIALNVIPSAITLSGGLDALDKVAFTISNSQATSANTSHVMIKINSADDAPVSTIAFAPLSIAEDSGITSLNLSSTFVDSDTGTSTYINLCQVDDDVLFSSRFTIGACSCAGLVCSANITPNTNVVGTYSFAYRIGSSDGVNPTQWIADRNINLTVVPRNDKPQISENTIFSPVTVLRNDTIAESTSTVPTEGVYNFYVAAGGDAGSVLYESGQTFTVTAESDNPVLVPNTAANLKIEKVAETPNIPAYDQYKLTVKAATNKSGIANIEIKVKDNGAVAFAGEDDEVLDEFQLEVTMVNDPPAFSSVLTTVNTNEGGAVQTDGFFIDEDFGSSSDEDVDGIRLTFSSDNTTVLPTTAISIFYDMNDNGVEEAATEARAHNTALETPCTPAELLTAIHPCDSKLHKVFLKLNPINGVAGNANIIVTATDGFSVPKTMSFSLIVHPIASIHGGWNNISANGIKTDKLNKPVSASELVCNYNKATEAANCGTKNCINTAFPAGDAIISPHGKVVPNAANVLFFDDTNKKCYRSTDDNEFSWVEHRTTCPITRETGICPDNNCITDGVLAPITQSGKYHYNTSSDVCSVSTAAGAWITYVPSKVNLSWNPFIISGSGSESGVQIAGWNVYRRESNIDYNFKAGHLRNSTSDAKYTIKDPSVRTFVDTTAIAGKVYYYLVRPVDNRRELPTYTPEIFSEVRITAPQPNTTFVHRWMINQEICNGMNMNTTTTEKVDPTANFRCPYYGPGATGGFYDYGSDLLVDTYEVGCPYAAAPKCSADGCVGIGAPVSTSNVVNNDLYYDRSSGICHVYTGSWEAMQSADLAEVTAMNLVNRVASALNAPLTLIRKDRAAEVCSTRPDQNTSYDLVGALIAKLPSKKDYMAYSGHPTTITDAEISDLEQGFSLNITSRCNGSAASGLEGAFTDSNIPSTSFAYTLPGTAASPIRSLVTGSIPLSSSKSTESCVSRYGIQDIYGNVAEWTTDQMRCADAANFVCTAEVGSSYYDYLFEDLSRYAFNMKTGPFNDEEPDGLVAADDNYLPDWTIADETYAGKFSFPTGMPIDINISSNALVDGSTAIPYILDIGPSSGITSSKLHDDGFIVNGADTNLDATKLGSFAVGGSYRSGARSGRFTSELVPSSVAGPDLGARCIIPVLDAVYPADTAHTYPY